MSAPNAGGKKIKFIDYTREIEKEINKDSESKRRRMKLNDTQIYGLEEAFRKNKHPSTASKLEMAERLKIPTKNVQVWFQNRRAREKHGSGLEGNTASSNDDISSKKNPDEI